MGSIPNRLQPMSSVLFAASSGHVQKDPTAHLRSSGVVPVILHRGLISSVGFSMLVQLSH